MKLARTGVLSVISSKRNNSAHVAGMATMAAFWLGTLPTLLGFSWLTTKVAPRLPAQLARLTPLLLVLLGLLALTGKWQALAGPCHDTLCMK